MPSGKKHRAFWGVALVVIGCAVLCAIVVRHLHDTRTGPRADVSTRVQGVLAITALLAGVVLLVGARSSARARPEPVLTHPPEPQMPDDAVTLRPLRARAAASGAELPQVPDDAVTLRPLRARAGASGPDLRTTRRIDVNVEVGMGGDSNFYLGLSENLSEGGLFVATYRTLPVGTDVALTVKLPNHPAPIHVHGTVRWVRDAPPEGHLSAGMGVRFEQVDEAHVALIRRFIASCAPMFFDE